MRQVRWAQCAGALCACSVIFPNFFRELLTPIVLIVFFMGSVFQVLHVRPVNIIYYKVIKEYYYSPALLVQLITFSL